MCTIFAPASDDAADGEVPVLAAPVAADDAVGRRLVEADRFASSVRHERGDGRLVRGRFGLNCFPKWPSGSLAGHGGPSGKWTM
jgi:hypothetical protein